MPIIKAPLHSFIAQGELADTLTYKRLGPSNLVIAKPTPTDPNTLPQHQHRWLYQYWSRVWHYMTPAEKAAFNPPAHIRHLTPYNRFMQIKLATPLDIAAYLPFDSTRHSDCYDTYQRQLIGQGWCTNNVLGPVDRAYQYDGIDDYSLFTANCSDLTTFSISFWLELLDTSKIGAVIGRPFAWDSYSPYSYTQRWSRVWFGFVTTQGIPFYGYPTGTGWHHHAMLWNGITQYFYFDNTLIYTNNIGGVMFPIDDYHYISRYFTGPSGYIPIRIDQILIARYFLSLPELRAQYLDKHAVFKELDP